MWNRVLEQVAAAAFAHLPAVLVPIVVFAINATERGKALDPHQAADKRAADARTSPDHLAQQRTVAGERSLDATMARIGLAVDKLNDANPGALDRALIDADLARLVSDVVDSTNAATAAITACSSDLKPVAA